MVFQLVYGLSDAYAIVGSQIYHSKTLPPFYKARSMVVLEAMTLEKRIQHKNDNFEFIASQKNSSHAYPPTRASYNNNSNTRGRGRRCGICHYH